MLHYFSHVKKYILSKLPVHMLMCIMMEKMFLRTEGGQFGSEVMEEMTNTDVSQCKINENDVLSCTSMLSTPRGAYMVTHNPPLLKSRMNMISLGAL